MILKGKPTLKKKKNIAKMINKCNVLQYKITKKINPCDSFSNNPFIDGIFASDKGRMGV